MFHFSTLVNMTLPELTEVWNRCWQGYYYEMNYTPEQMRIWLNLGQISLNHSVCLRKDRKVIGFALLALDGSDAWIAGTSIDPQYRGQRLFAPLLKAQLKLANNLGLKRVYLEVLAQNHARHVYESIGFVPLRELYIYKYKAAQGSPKTLNPRHQIFRAVNLKEYFVARQNAQFKPAWQRRESFLKRYRFLLPLTNSAETAGILFTGEQSTTLLDAWSSSLEQGKDILKEILKRTKGRLTLTNQPKDLISAYLSTQGISPTATQIEMCYYFD